MASAMIKRCLCAVIAIAAMFTLTVGQNVGRAGTHTDVPVSDGAVTIGPENTKLQFVCAHVGPKPDPRKGGFAKFTGKAIVDPATKRLQTIVLDIDTSSLWTEFDMLTNHLKSPDFFEVRRFPTAKFESTKIEPSSGQVQILGKLTLHGVTKEVTIPATIAVTDAGLRIASEFTINRLDFGISYDPKKVEDKVTLTVVVGDKP
jgi:polyisoprenoid-binding protein YceI